MRNNPVKALLLEQGLKPEKKLGQNFLVNKKILQKIIEAAEITRKDTVVEIGSGIGNLTQELAKKAEQVLAIEKDPEMCKLLLERPSMGNVKVIQGDVLKIPLSELAPHGAFKVVANLPYYIASPVIRKLLEAERPPESMVLMVQKEVGQRICAKPPKMSLLAVSVQFYGKPKIISYVSKKDFWPQPKVDSAVIKIVPHKPDEISVDPQLFFTIVKAGFSQPRKQILNNLSIGLTLPLEVPRASGGILLSELKLNKEKARRWLLKNGLQPTRRAETLLITDWISLAKTFPSI